MNNNEERGNNGNTILLTVIGVATLLVALVGATFAYFSASIKDTSQESVLITTGVVAGLEYVGSNGISLSNIVPGDSGESTFTITNPAKATNSEGTEVDNKVVMTYDLDLVIDENALVVDPDDGATADDTLNDQMRLYFGATMTNAGHDGTGNGTGNAVSSTLKNFESPTVNGNTLQANSDTSDAKYSIYYNVTDSTKVTTGSKYKIIDDQQIGINGTVTYSLKIDFRNLAVPQNKNQGKTFTAHIEGSDYKSVKTSSVVKATAGE